MAGRSRPKYRVAPSKLHGRGVFAAGPLRRDELIGVFEGRPTRRDGAFVLWVVEDDRTYGLRGTNALRFVNHSDRPNAAFDGLELRALRPIRVGTEITHDYAGDL